MPSRNRVTPLSQVLALPHRGAFTGNRGILHDADGEMGRALWRHPHWITCTLNLKAGRGKLPLAAPRHYTPLFFHDEAVAVAAGHRPCAECRRPVYAAFKAAWAQVYGPCDAAAIDRRLHAARLGPDRQQRRWQAKAASLPSGTFILHEGLAHLIWQDSTRAFVGGGYGPDLALPRGEVQVLTPEPMVEVMRAGWAPVLSADDDRPSWPDNAIPQAPR